jgi:hypothetical protein
MGCANGSYRRKYLIFLVDVSRMICEHKHENFVTNDEGNNERVMSDED